MKKESENSSANEEDNTHRRQMFSFFLLAPPPDLSKNENFVKSIKSKYLNSTNVLGKKKKKNYCATYLNKFSLLLLFIFWRCITYPLISIRILSK